MYPLKFRPVYKDYIWGGRSLSKFGRDLPEGIVAESWDISSHPNGMSVVENGPLAGKSLSDLIRTQGQDILGHLWTEGTDSFPLLVKLIDANDRLSVQVHPDDAYAGAFENGQLGKNEMWYIMDAAPGAKLIYGLREGVTPESFEKAVSEGRMAECMNEMEVHPGDIINIPAGMVHAIGAGIVIAEIQQSSDLTYRLYDYDRVGADGKKRPLHLDKARQVINFEIGEGRMPGLTVEESDSASARVAIANRYFVVEDCHVSGVRSDRANGNRFRILVFSEGEGSVSAQGETLRVRAGDSVLIPAACTEVQIEGKLRYLRAYVPRLGADVVGPLLDKGISIKEMTDKVAGLSACI